MRDSDSRKGIWIFILFGAISGSIIGELIGNNFKFFQFLKASYKIGTSIPLVINLKVIELTIGFNFYINILTILGIIMSIILYKKFF